MSGLSDDEWEACARNPDDEKYLNDQERALLRLLDAERARADAANSALGQVVAALGPDELCDCQPGDASCGLRDEAYHALHLSRSALNRKA